MSRRRNLCQACFRAPQLKTKVLCKACLTIRKRFNVDPKDIVALRRMQGNCCAICGNQCSSGRALAVDHDHNTGNIRGLLCTRCNMGIGLLRTSELLSSAINYINQPPLDLSYLPKHQPHVVSLAEHNLLVQFIKDDTLLTLRSKARAFAASTGLTEVCAMSRIRRALRTVSRRVSAEKATQQQGDTL